MFRLTEEQFQKRLKKINEYNTQKERYRLLKEELNKGKKKIQLPTTSKLVLLVVFLMCIEVLFFCQYAMIALNDSEAMYALIGVPAALVPICLGYFSKSKQENSANGIVYETTMERIRQSKNESDNSVG